MSPRTLNVPGFAKRAARATSVVLATFLTIAALSGGPQAHAAIIMDQIGPNPHAFDNATGYESLQYPATANAVAYDDAVVDDFVAPAGVTTLTNVQAVLYSPTTNDFLFIPNYRVEIYSSLAAANASTNGDVANVTIPAATATTVVNYDDLIAQALVLLPVDIVLPTAGTYYLAVQSETGISGFDVALSNNTVVGSLPGDDNAIYENPGGGYRYPNNQIATGEDAAYRIVGTTAVPEPALSLAALTGLATCITVRRRR